MVAGFLTSYAGSTLLLGASAGLVAAGDLPLRWLPVYRTVEAAEDLCSPFVAHAVRRFRATGLLLVVEAADLLATAAALFAIVGFNVQIGVTVASYLLAVSLLPLIVDLAEEMFASDVEGAAPGAALRVNSTLYAGVGVVAGVLSRPLGSLLAQVSVVVLLLLNLVVTTAGLVLRWRAAQLAPRARSHDVEQQDRRSSTELRMLSMHPGMPPVSFLLASWPAVVSPYVALWIANGNPARLVGALLCSGVGAVAGPLLARRATKTDAGRALILAAAAAAGACLAAAGVAHFAPRAEGVLAAGAALLIIAAAGTAAVVLNATARQTTLQAVDFRRVLGWAHASSALGVLAGSWLGYAIESARRPAAGFTVAALVATTTAVLTTSRVRASARR